MSDTTLIGADEIRQVQDYVRREFSVLMRPCAAPLYYYTDGAAAAAILDDAQIKAVNILYVDDGREMLHSLDVFHMAIQTHRAAGGVRGELADIITGYLSEVGHYVPPDIWLTNFSTIPDGAHQWRGLEDHGHGVALGFAPAAITRAAESAGALLAPCFYRDDVKIALVGRGLELLQILYERRLSRGRQKGSVEALARYVIREMALFGALMKPEPHADEQEWRMVLCNPSQTPLGARRIKALPRHDYTGLYIDLDIVDATDRAPVSEIIIGPSPRQQMTERAFRTLLYKHGYERAEVRTAHN